jgi:protein O-GlcNAc transferase
MDSATGKLFDEARELLRNGALDEAARRYADILRSDSANADALYYLAQVNCRQGRLDEGIALVQRALAIDSRQARAHNLLGLALSRLGQAQAALASFDAAIAVDPKHADAHGNRADALAALGRRQEAVASYDRAIALAPGSFANWCNRGVVLYELRRFAEAVQSFERAGAIDPSDGQTHFNRGNALSGLARYEDALAAFEAALAVDPHYTDALYNRGCLLSKLKRYDDAVACFERLLTISPQHTNAVGELVNCHLLACDWDNLARNTGRLEAALADEQSIISPFTLLGLDVEPRRLRDCNARFVAHQTRAAQAFVHRPETSRSGKLRIAYLGDFNRHPVSYLTAGLFELHDRTRFDVTGMAFGPDDGSDIRARIARSFDRFIDASSLSDHDAPQVLHDLGIDIAVDLVGHTENARPGVLARRPAPIQVSYLGYLATMSADYIDYVIADPIVLPADRQPFYSEAIVHLPDCFMVHDPRQAVPRKLSRADAGLPQNGFVFCSFNHSYKIREPVFDAWMRLLRDVQGSVLWLLGANERAVANLRRAAAKRSVDPARLIFAGRVDLAEHLDRQRLADLFLDTVPYNGGATASAALWAGIPLVTCLGTSLVGRMAASMLHAAGLPELVAANLTDYVALAAALARDPTPLQSLRHTLEQSRLSQPLFDTDRFRRHLEAAYATGSAPNSRRRSPSRRALERRVHDKRKGPAHGRAFDHRDALRTGAHGWTFGMNQGDGNFGPCEMRAVVAFDQERRPAADIDVPCPAHRLVERLKFLEQHAILLQRRDCIRAARTAVNAIGHGISPPSVGLVPAFR